MGSCCATNSNAYPNMENAPIVDLREKISEENKDKIDDLNPPKGIKLNNLIINLILM